MKKRLLSLLTVCVLTGVVLSLSACGRMTDHVTDLNDDLSGSINNSGENTPVEFINTPAPTVSVITDSASGSAMSNSDVSNTSDSASTQKYNEFMQKAGKIEVYESNQVQTAMSQREINSATYDVYTKWDELLNEVYQYLKANMNSSDFEQLKNDEIRWIKEKEAAVEVAAADWEGGSGEPMARNSTASEYTKKRCYYLISLVK